MTADLTGAANDTIAAIATPAGRGGIGVIRLSGEHAWQIAAGLCERTIQTQTAVYTRFVAANGAVIDDGLVIGFKAPNSFTGEDVVELQGHGSPVAQQLLLESLVQAGARLAAAGEYSKRAYLNDKLDLAQAEAIADLINSATKQAALSAVRSLQGEFSSRINSLLHELINIRSFVEAAIDFPEEEIDFLSDARLQSQLAALQTAVAEALAQAQQGTILANGIQMVLAGKPNAGKSSLLNTLTGYDTAIVTPVAGTTRDIVSQTIDLDGLPVHIRDTAGIRETADEVEQIRVQRAHQAIEQADWVLYLIDVEDADHSLPDWCPANTTRVFTKLDLNPGFAVPDGAVSISVNSGAGLDNLKRHIKQIVGFQDQGEDTVSARQRHVDALARAQLAINTGAEQLKQHQAGELLADELHTAQRALSEITGEFSNDDLLGHIFASFCIGK